MTEKWLPESDNKFKENIKITHYDLRLINKESLERIKWHEGEALRLREANGLTATFYIPETHPIVTGNLIQDGRRFEWKSFSGGKEWRETYYVKTFKPYGTLAYILSDAERAKLNLGHRYYWEMDCLFERAEPVIRTSGILIEDIIKL